MIHSYRNITYILQGILHWIQQRVSLFKRRATALRLKRETALLLVFKKFFTHTYMKKSYRANNYPID